MKCKLYGCNKEARRKFCSNKHKDRFHNITNPRGKFAHLRDVPFHSGVEDDDLADFDEHYDPHPFSSEGLGQWEGST